MKPTVIAILVAGVLIGGAIMLGGKSSNQPSAGSFENVSVVDGKQVITLDAKGGYSPKVTIAKADMPTVLRVKTNGTFDCSSGLRIPSIGYGANLPPTGVTEIEIPPQKAGTSLKGVCVMGMYNFSINYN